MQPGVHAGVPEALDAQHGLLGRAEHCEWLIMKLALKLRLINTNLLFILRILSIGEHF